MFWRMAGLSTASPVETILDKENYTLEELLDEDEIIQECKALNGRLINFLLRKGTGRATPSDISLKKLPRMLKRIVSFKFPFIACEIFTCEVDIILKTLVEDEELMHLLFSFLEPNRSHSTLLAGYFSKVVISLMLRKTVPFMNFVQAHQEFFRQMVDLIGITSIMEVLIRLIGADEHIYTNYMDAMQWLEDTDVLEMIVDKFSSSDCPEVHANAAETLCAITRYAPPGISAKISSPSFIGRLFQSCWEDSRPTSVLVHSLSVCISLLDPKRSSSSPYHMYRGQLTQGPTITANPEMVEGMLESLGDLLKLLDISSAVNILETTYGKLHPPLGKHRLKRRAEKELIRLGAIQRILDLFFEYPFNNFLHHHVENIVVLCLESKKTVLVEHVLYECNLVDKIMAAESQFLLATDFGKVAISASSFADIAIVIIFRFHCMPTIPTEGRSPPRIGNIGHITRISNKLLNLGNNNTEVQAYLQENTEWADWHTDVLLKRNSLENVYQWACGSLLGALRQLSHYICGGQPHYRIEIGISGDDDFRDRDYDVAALANNLSQAFRYGIYNNDDAEEGHGSLERDDRGIFKSKLSFMCFCCGHHEKVISQAMAISFVASLCDVYLTMNLQKLSYLPSVWGDEQDRKAFKWLTPSPSPDAEETGIVSSSSDDEVVLGEDDDLDDNTTSSPEPDSSPKTNDPGILGPENGVPEDLDKDTRPSSPVEGDKPPEWVQWRETSDLSDPSDAEQPPALPNGELALDSENVIDSSVADSSKPSVSAGAVVDSGDPDAGGSPKSPNESSVSDPSKPGDEDSSSKPTAVEDMTTVERDDTDKAVEHIVVENVAGK
ncbi:hypothetical protein IFM89_030353 [Coptis chinensis]|uniref:SIT4 phosphatase-associated family protein n=1 Tax=Coptis chinensis TaxID=261450 RepID=A0A835MAF0_9MAGN|nr:hypothetical protein IFM89_030353 [Coptis chinensis]